MYMLNIFAQQVFADVTDGTAQFGNPLGKTTEFSALIAKVLHAVVQIGIPVLVIFIVIAGFKFVTAQGSEKGITEAKDAFKWAVIGGAVLLGAQIIADVIANTVGKL